MKKSIKLLFLIITLLILLISASAQTDVTKLPLLYKVNGQENVKIQKDIVYKRSVKLS